ncbi:TIR domain-containing protein [Bacillus wiedmannii]|uniref:TIR domain-containing protein n=1 Tax=Bacillus wiedmannii TaxID=1890302 RepID=UPI0034CF33AC
MYISFCKKCNNLINYQLRIIKTSIEFLNYKDSMLVTCVLIKSQTFNRRWVRYEIMKSIEKGNKILEIHINGFKDKYGNIKTKNLIPLII